MMSKYNRQQLEQFIVHEQRILQECVDVLNHKTPLSEWPHDVRVAFLLAIREGEGKEAYKAFKIARHLRITRQFHADDVPQHPTPFQRRCSERIRADLAKLIQLGAGRYLQP